MPDALLVVSFSPIQAFIAEARRAADLYAASHLLSEIAWAAVAVLQQAGTVIYPQGAQDAPNVLVARVPAGQVETVARTAEDALRARWAALAQASRRQLEQSLPPSLQPDGRWDAIWQRQVAGLWEVYWAAAELGPDYATAYRQARQGLDAAKRARFFGPAAEDGLKDSLSGARSALRTDRLDAKAYWQAVQQAFTRRADIRLRAGERLDASGVAKRFYTPRAAFESTSDIAAGDYLRQAGREGLVKYARTIYRLLASQPPANLDAWPAGLDADWLYDEALTPDRLQRETNLTDPDPAALSAAQQALQELHRKEGRPPTYYGLILLDGDGMGAAVDGCRTEAAHVAFSQRLSAFAAQVRELLGGRPGQVIYAGGDDVLALAPAGAALEQAWRWAEAFAASVQRPDGQPCSASAGVVIAHHRAPLGAALRAVREAERDAKALNRRPGPAGAVCVRWLKRGGETLEARGRWPGLAQRLQQAQDDFSSERLAARFPYALAREADLAAALPQAARGALLTRLLTRHAEAGLPLAERAADWLAWSQALDVALPEEKDEAGAPGLVGFRELARWLILARFLAQAEKGGE